MELPLNPLPIDPRPIQAERAIAFAELMQRAWNAFLLLEVPTSAPSQEPHREFSYLDNDQVHK